MRITDQSLEGLLRAAGRSAASPPDIRPELAERVRRLHRRRRHKRKLVGGLVVATLVLGGAFATGRLARGPTPPSDAPVAKRPVPPRGTRSLSAEEIEHLRTEIAELGAEAERRREAAERMSRQRRPGRQLGGLRPESKEPDLLSAAEMEFEKTAFLLVDFAERRTTANPDAVAADAYRQVLRLFPDTQGARTARERLAKYSTGKGGS